MLSVAREYNLNTDMVTQCFKDVVTAFRKLLHEEKNCELPFPKIGKLQVKNKVVTMKFYQEFLEKQNEQLKAYTENEKQKHRAANYDPDWGVDRYNKNKVSGARPRQLRTSYSRKRSVFFLQFS